MEGKYFFNNIGRMEKIIVVWLYIFNKDMDIKNYGI